METVTQNGKTFVKASSIARELGYTSDYVGQLCREKHVDCERVGRAWFVNEESIKKYKKNRYRSSVKKSKDEVKKTLDDRTEGETSNGYYAQVTARYETDNSDLIPTTKKLDQKKGIYTGSHNEKKEREARLDEDTGWGAEQAQEHSGKEGTNILIKQGGEEDTIADRVEVPSQVPKSFQFDKDPYPRDGSENEQGRDSALERTVAKDQNAPPKVTSRTSAFTVSISVLLIAISVAFLLISVVFVRSLEYADGNVQAGYSTSPGLGKDILPL